MAPDTKPDSIGQRHGVTIMSIVLAVLFFVQVRV